MMGMTNRPIIENGMKYFKCKKCGEVKPLNKSYFHVNMNTRLGFISKCISCVKKEIENKPKVKYITRAELEEENKKLKEYNGELIENHKKDIAILCEENKKLREKIERWEKCFKKGGFNPQDVEYLMEEENKKLREKLSEITMVADDEKQSIEHILELEEENKKLREENQYRESVADVLPEGRGHIAEETIQDLQKRIDELVWFEKEYHRSRERIKKLEWVLEHDYDRKIPY